MGLNLIFYDNAKQELNCEGEWDITHFSELESLLNNIRWPTQGEIIFNGKSLTKMDSAGAWLLIKWQHLLSDKGLKVSFQAFNDEAQSLIEIVRKRYQDQGMIPSIKKLPQIAAIGKFTITQTNEFLRYLGFVGKLFTEALRVVPNPNRWRLKALANIIYQTGYLALPIIAILSFMIGVVITYQMGLQLRAYGANIFIVDLLGLGILREFAPLLTAIMVAGRTGSSFTAQIGMMKLNQEIDALDTMGITPDELLLLPRILGLFIVLPLITFWSDIFGIFGGMVMSNNMLHITWSDFLHRFPQVIPLKTLLIGLGKAPVFALVIASIATYQGMNVKLSSESIGRNTTRSVVLAIFFIIILDAMFSIIFSKLKL